MYEQVGKPEENKSRAVANSVAQRKSNVKHGLGFVDNRSIDLQNNKTIQRGGKNSKPASLDNNLLPWDGALSVGYHSTKAWKAIKESGEFKPGGGKLGTGIYAATNQQLAEMYGSFGSEPAVTLEVGFKGNIDDLTTIHLKNVSEYNAEMEGQYDVIYLDSAVLGQACFKMDGPANLTADHIRIRNLS